MEPDFLEERGRSFDLFFYFFWRGVMAFYEKSYERVGRDPAKKKEQKTACLVDNKTRAAEILGISLKTLFNKLKEYGAAEADSPA